MRSLFSLLSVHAMSSGLKVYVSTAVVEDSETCRRACGGHGFMASAGLAAIYAHQLPSTTYEGDNYILCQQVCRAAIKIYGSQSQPGGQPKTSVTNAKEAITLLQSRAAAAVQRLSQSKSKSQSWTDLSWKCISVAKAVTEANIARHIGQSIEALAVSYANLAEADILKLVYELVSNI